MPVGGVHAIGVDPPQQHDRRAAERIAGGDRLVREAGGPPVDEEDVARNREVAPAEFAALVIELDEPYFGRDRRSARGGSIDRLLREDLDDRPATLAAEAIDHRLPRSDLAGHLRLDHRDLFAEPTLLVDVGLPDHHRRCAADGENEHQHADRSSHAGVDRQIRTRCRNAADPAAARPQDARVGWSTAKRLEDDPLHEPSAACLVEPNVEDPAGQGRAP